MSEKWVQAWGQAHSALSFFYYPSCEKTYRMIIKSAIQGKKIKLELSNECAKNDVEIGSVTVAKCNKNGDFIGDYENITFKKLLQDMFGKNIKKKQTKIVKETGFTIDVVKKVSQLKKIYSKIEEQIMIQISA